MCGFRACANLPTRDLQDEDDADSHNHDMGAGAANSISGEVDASHSGRAKSIMAGSVSPAASACGGGSRGRARSVGAGRVEEDARQTWREQRRVVREEMQR
jgi:hypothetical protein